ncbi:/ / LicD family protein / 57578:58435 Forward [Candidatus Hepatoplasma crinochetorum]|uniref:/ / LicD family protein / 57578:58435 Forward n=1 Tax=Candidatus Hepatoplasma crinochetorum TaxID=295596 RepID=A0A0G7ZNC2_9MOLU|nr:/ / LicD family protein / 57578:58435 Forward [Candidatus Hepatoplasma crinochetorum]
MKKIQFKEFQKINIEGFKKINQNILKNKIKWWAHSGTLLGMIRDNKLIPWDDDIDMGMRIYDFRKNFELLKKIGEDANYELFDRKNYFGLDVARFIYKEKFIIQFKDKEYISSPYIDIMLAVKSKNNLFIKRKFWSSMNKLSFIYNSFLIPLPYFGWKFNKLKKIYWYEQLLIHIFRFIFFFLILILPIQNYWLKRKAKNNNNKVSFYYNYDNLGIIYDIKKLVERDFLGEKILISENYLEELNLRFKNWKQLPEEKKQIPHHLFLTPNLDKFRNKYKIYPFIIK